MEIEAKFIVPDAETCDRLKQTDRLADYLLTAREPRRVRDTYLDTRDRRLLAAGYACRLRKQDDATLVTIKSMESAQGALHRREEYEVLVPTGERPAEWETSPVRALLVKVAGTEPLQALFQLEQTRTIRSVECDGREVAELSIDEVRLNTGANMAAYVELEVEAKEQGIEADIVTLAAVLQDEWRLTPQTESKFERGLALLDSAPPPGPAPAATLTNISLDDTMAEAARKTLLFHLKRMLDEEPCTRAGEVEPLHDMRVATRRMRAALRVFDGYIDTAAYKPFARILRRTGRMLGAVRDLDVAREKTRRYIENLSPERRGELDTFIAVRDAEYNRRREALLAHLDGDDYARLTDEFLGFLQTPGAGRLPAPSPDREPEPECVRHVLPMTLYAGYARIRAFEDTVLAPDVPLTRLHQLRIASKGLRYTLEFFEDVLAPEAAELIDECKRLQDHLGDLQDAVVSSGVLRDFLVWGEWPSGEDKSAPSQVIVAPGVAAYLAAQQNEIQRLVSTFPPIWGDMVGEKFRRMLAGIVARL